MLAHYVLWLANVSMYRSAFWLLHHRLVRTFGEAKLHEAHAILCCKHNNGDLAKLLYPYRCAKRAFCCADAFCLACSCAIRKPSTSRTSSTVRISCRIGKMSSSSVSSFSSMNVPMGTAHSGCMFHVAAESLQASIPEPVHPHEPEPKEANLKNIGMWRIVHNDGI